MNALPIESGCPGRVPTRFSSGCVITQNLLEVFKEFLQKLQHLFHFFQCHPLTVDFLFPKSPAFERIVSNVAHKLPFKALPKRGIPNTVSNSREFCWELRM
ncbi:hypothetical protein H1C71_011216 [Ictidomys tridecemlineatus]|nr:hypothetical protein H1C71_011216 [Ictidomys tridecemlineatus]